jgi:iron complex transport system substrate-binding protein
MKHTGIFLLAAALTVCGAGSCAKSGAKSGIAGGAKDDAKSATPEAARAASGQAAADVSADAAASYWKTETRQDGEYIVDGEGNAIPLRRYERIAVLSPGAVETLYLIGGEGCIAAIASSSEPVWPPEKTALLPSVGNVARPSLEALINAEPDLVIGNGMNSAFVADFAGRGGGSRGSGGTPAGAIVHNANSLDDIFTGAFLLGKLCGREEAAAALVREKREIIASIAADGAKNPLSLKGAFLYSVNPLMAFNSASLAGNVLDVLGVENIAAGLAAAQSVISAEYLITQNPDFLFGAMSIRKPDDILSADSAVLKTRAGKEGNISIIPSSYFLRPSPRLADKLPELYREVRRYGKAGGN